MKLKSGPLIIYKADGKPSLVDLNGEHVANMNFKLSKINGELIQDISGESFGTEIADKVICY
jgi:hypothetical protein